MKGFITLSVTALALTASPLESGCCGPSLYEVEGSPYTTFIARKVGDLVTVVVSESATTKDTGKRIQERKNDSSFELAKMFLPPFNVQEGLTRLNGGGDSPGIEFTSENKFDAKAENDSKHTLKTTIQCRLLEEISEGQFVIRGYRLVNLNGKEKRIYISGVLRQRDITTSNTVKSDELADATLEIDGEVAHRDVEPGIFMKIMNAVF